MNRSINLRQTYIVYLPSGAAKSRLQRLEVPIRVKSTLLCRCDIGEEEVKDSDEREALNAEARRSGDNAEIMPWDWRYYSEKVRKARYDFDDSKLQPYLDLDNMIRANHQMLEALIGRIPPPQE